MSGKKIIDGLKDAVAGNFSRVTIEGQTWVRLDEGYEVVPSQSRCYRCKKWLSSSFMLGDHKNSWHARNLAPHAASGGMMVPVCDECEPTTTITLASA